MCCMLNQKCNVITKRLFIKLNPEVLSLKFRDATFPFKKEVLFFFLTKSENVHLFLNF